MPESSPPSGPLREQLRAATTVAHARLDALMSHGLHTRSDYRAYLYGMHAFVASVVPQVRAQADALAWALPDWQAQLSRDLDAVDPGWSSLAAEAGATPHADAALGALYVIEGSALGARTLLRDATTLGYAEGEGAEFLHGHAGRTAGQRWQRFLALLEDAGRGADRDQACDGAQHTFQLAERCFRRARGLSV